MIKQMITALLFVSIYTYADDSKIKSDLLEVERSIGRANLTCDYDFFRSVEGKEFFFTDLSGHVITRDQDLTGEKDCKKRDGAFSLSDTRVLLYGDIAVVNAVATYTIRDARGETVRKSRFTDVFVRRSGAWIVVAGHSSSIKDPAN